MANGEAKSTPEAILARLLVLGALLLAVNLWCNRHLGLPALTLVLSGSVAAIISLFKGFLSEEHAGPIKDLFQNWCLKLISPTFLTLATLAFVVVGFTFSSVTIVAAGAPTGGADGLKVEVFREGDASSPVWCTTLRGQRLLARTVRITALGGNPYSLKVEGFVDYSFDLQPWSGATIRIGEDLQRAPSILLRIPPEVIVNRDVGTLELFRLDASGKRAGSLARMSTANHGAIMVGPPESIPAHFTDIWERELRARDVTSGLSDDCLLLWSRPLLASTEDALRPGMIVDAEFRLDDEKLKTTEVQAAATFVVTREQIQDILLTRKE